MKILKSTTLATLVLSLFFLGACQSTEIRHSDEDYRTGDDLERLNVTEIVVEPVDMGPAVMAESIEERQLPARKMRRMIRRYLIERKDYAAPRENWVDERLSDPRSMDTDALMSVSVLQWDTSRLERRGVIYATATFELKSPDKGTLLWRYTCRDYQLIVEAPHGGKAVSGNNIAAARLLAETALSRLPRK